MTRPCFGPAVTECSGYSLIEVLVALAVLSVVVTITLSGLTLGARARETVCAEGERLAEVQTALTLYEQDLIHAFYRPVSAPHGPEPAFEYRAGPAATRHAFTTLATAAPGEHEAVGAVRVEWFRQGGALIRREWLYPDRTALTPSVEAVVLSGVRGYRVAFMDTTHEWRAQWPSPRAPKEQDSLPVAVRVRLVLEDWGEIERIVVLRAP